MSWAEQSEKAERNSRFIAVSGFMAHQQRWGLLCRSTHRDPPQGTAKGLWHLRQMVDPGGIPAGNLGLLLLRTLRQNLPKDLLGPGEGGFDMGIIGAPQEIVHADDVPQLYAQAIFLEAVEYVAVEIVAGQHGFLKPVAVLLGPLGVRVVDPVQEMGDPGQLHLY
jgi:hypothetical protein